MVSRLSMASTPNLFISSDGYLYSLGDDIDFRASSQSLCRAHSLKRINFESESQLSRAGGSSKGSNLLVTTSFVNLCTSLNGSSKGVHFCPIVSEVSWHDSYSSENDNSSIDSNSIPEPMEPVATSPLLTTALTQSLQMNLEPEVNREMSPTIDEIALRLLSESVCSARRDENDKERIRCAQRKRLDFITSPPPERVHIGGGSHVTHRTTMKNPNANTSSDCGSTSTSSHLSATLASCSMNSQPCDVSVGSSPSSKTKSSMGKLGSFFQRFSLKRISGRKGKSKKSSGNTTAAPPVVVGCVRKNGSNVVDERSNSSRMVPLSDDVYGHHIPADTANDINVVSSKPPLPPFTSTRRRTSDDFDDPALLPSSTPYSSAVQQLQQYSQRRVGGPNTPTMLGQPSCIDPHTGIGLLETDIDSNVVTLSPANANTTSNPRHRNDNKNTHGSPVTKISRSLLNLDDGRMAAHQQLTSAERTKPTSPHRTSNEYRARSMEFLLDKENQEAIQAPENELQKGNGERKMSEHELRVQRSLQKLNVPEWYKNFSVPSQGFLLKRPSDAGHNSQLPQRWNIGSMPSKTTSLNSLGPHLPTTPKSPTYTANSPSPSHYSFSRWSTSRLNSSTNSSSTSPCGSARSSFNYRQPYLGWRSQERLAKPRTPSERLAAGILQNCQNDNQQSSPSLTEVRSSIKEVTSAIVHYVSGIRDSTDRLSPSLRSSSPRGSTGRLCWLESSFVGNRPTKQPETPSGQCESKVPRMPSTSEKANSGDYQSSYTCVVSTTNTSGKSNENHGYNNRTSNGACNQNTTVLQNVSQQQLAFRANAKRRRSEGVETFTCNLQLNNDRRISYDNRRCSDEAANTSASGSEQDNNSNIVDISKTIRKRERCAASNVKLVVQCSYPKCGKTAEPSQAKNTYKVCHNCDYVYCSRDCRREHWPKHRKLCLHYRVGELCRQVLAAIKLNENMLLTASTIARKGFLSNGRGCVKFYFHTPQLAEHFAAGNMFQPQASYIKWTELIASSDVTSELHLELCNVCKSYNPETRLVILVAIHVVSEVPSNGAVVKWERQIISKYAKTKLSPNLIAKIPALCGGSSKQTNKHPETLILTSLPGVPEANSKGRQVNFTNIQRELRQRGVNLQGQYPEVYKKLCDYVESGEHFPATTIHPTDLASGKTFMCVIMPEAKAYKLDFLIQNHWDAKMVDVASSNNTLSGSE